VRGERVDFVHHPVGGCDYHTRSGADVRVHRYIRVIPDAIRFADTLGGCAFHGY
jgi:hypothetical protein